MRTAETVCLWKKEKESVHRRLIRQNWKIRALLFMRRCVSSVIKRSLQNGDQTDTIYEGMDKQMTFEQSLRSREFEPDGPNYTPRISGVMHIENGTYNYAMSILKSNNGNPESCCRYTFAYENPVAGEGHFIHT